jgi:hypothetical protein
MNEGINLLAPNKNKGSGDLLRRIQKMRFLTIALLFIVSVSSVILFILVALSPLPALQKQAQSLQQSLATSKDSIVKLTLVNSQTDSISQLLTKRKSFELPLRLIQDKFSGDMKIEQLQMDDSIVLITVESSSLHSVDTFINGLANYVQEKNTFSKVILVDLAIDEATNSYSATVQLNYL